MEHNYIVEAYPQGAKQSKAPFVARLETRSFTIAQRIAAMWRKEGFEVQRRLTNYEALTPVPRSIRLGRMAERK